MPVVLEIGPYEIVDRVRPCDDDWDGRFVIREKETQRWVLEGNTCVGFSTMEEAVNWAHQRQDKKDAQIVKLLIRYFQFHNINQYAELTFLLLGIVYFILSIVKLSKGI